MARRLILAAAVATAWTGACARAPADSPPPPPADSLGIADLPVEHGPMRVVTPVSPVASREIGRLDGAVQRFARDHAGRLPASLVQLQTEAAPEGGTYLRSVPMDPWGQPFSYAVLNVRYGSYDLRSYGPDRMAGTPDDVVARADPVDTH